MRKKYELQASVGDLEKSLRKQKGLDIIEVARVNLKKLGKTGTILGILGLTDLALFYSSISQGLVESEQYGLIGLSFILGAGAIGYNLIKQEEEGGKIQEAYAQYADLRESDRKILSKMNPEAFYSFYSSGRLPNQIKRDAPRILRLNYRSRR